jgi:hypothetical protein
MGGGGTTLRGLELEKENAVPEQKLFMYRF